MGKLLRKLLIGTTALPFADSTISQLAAAAVSIGVFTTDYSQYFIDNKSEIWSLPLIVHSKG